MIVTRKDGQGKPRYMVRLDVPVNLDGEFDPESGTKKRISFGTYRLFDTAKRVERQTIDKIEAGTLRLLPLAPVAAPKIWTVADIVGEWLAARKLTVTPNTYAGYESAARVHLLPALGIRDITGLTRSDVKGQLEAWQSQGVGEQLQNRVLMILSAAIDKAVEDERKPVSVNVAARIEKPSPKKSGDVAEWTPEELSRFLAEGEQDQYGVLWHLLALEGLRRGEGLGARWRNLTWNDDETACTVSIRQTVVPDADHGGAPLLQARTKTKKSRRTVTLTLPTVEALRRHRDRQKFERQRLGDVWPVELDLIVTNELGGPVRPDSVKAHRLDVVSRAGVPDPGTHGLRHGSVTRMVQAGVSLAIVAEKIGHADVGLTYATYSHLVAADQSAANAATEAFLAEARPSGTQG